MSNRGYNETPMVPSNYKDVNSVSLKAFDSHFKTLNNGLLSVARNLSGMHAKLTDVENTNAAEHATLMSRVETLEKTIEILCGRVGYLNANVNTNVISDAQQLDNNTSDAQESTDTQEVEPVLENTSISISTPAKANSKKASLSTKSKATKTHVVNKETTSNESKILLSATNMVLTGKPSNKTKTSTTTNTSSSNSSALVKKLVGSVPEMDTPEIDTPTVEDTHTVEDPPAISAPVVGSTLSELDLMISEEMRTPVVESLPVVGEPSIVDPPVAETPAVIEDTPVVDPPVPVTLEESEEEELSDLEITDSDEETKPSKKLTRQKPLSKPNVSKTALTVEVPEVSGDQIDTPKVIETPKVAEEVPNTAKPNTVESIMDSVFETSKKPIARKPQPKKTTTKKTVARK